MLPYAARIARRGGTLIADAPKPFEGTTMDTINAELIEPSALHLAVAQKIIDAHAGSQDVSLQFGIAAALAYAESHGPTGIGHNQPPIDLLPEALIDPDALPDLFARNYGPLIQRGADLVAGMERWKAKHQVPRPPDWPEGMAWPIRYAVPDEADNNKCSDFVRMIASYAGGRSPASGEVNEARETVKKPVLAAGASIDAWFNNLRDPLRRDVALIDNAQRDFLQAKLRREQEERDRAAAAALEESNRLAEAARVAGGTDAAVEQAVVAEEKAVAAVKAAEATPAEMTRSRSAAGTTTALGGKWIWRLADMMELAKAVVAGKVALQFLTTNDPVIGAAVRVRNGMRECPGLIIEEEAQVRRAGRTS